MQLQRRADDPALYDKATHYLQKVQEHGRRPMGFWHWLWILVLLIAEAAMFGYVLAGYVTPGGSEALQLQGALVIGTLIAGILVWMTHKTGKELHERALIRKARTWWQEYKEEPRRDGAGEPGEREATEWRPPAERLVGYAGLAAAGSTEWAGRFKRHPDYVRSSCSNLRTGPRPDPGGVHGVLQLFRPVLGHRHALPAT